LPDDDRRDRAKCSITGTSLPFGTLATPAIAEKLGASEYPPSHIDPPLVGDSAVDDAENDTVPYFGSVKLLGVSE